MVQSDCFSIYAVAKLIFLMSQEKLKDFSGTNKGNFLIKGSDLVDFEETKKVLYENEDKLKSLGDSL